MRLDGAVLFVKDFSRMLDFYAAMFQARPVNKDAVETYAAFELDGGGFALHAIPEEYARDIDIASPAPAREENPIKLIFAVDDVRAERSRLEAMGVSMLRRPWQNPAEVCDGIDPEGNVFQLVKSAR